MPTHAVPAPAFDCEQPPETHVYVAQPCDGFSAVQFVEPASAPQPAMGVWPQPPSSVQLSAVQASPSSQLGGSVPRQRPVSHASIVPSQLAPLSQLAPSARTSFAGHTPLSPSHTSSGSQSPRLARHTAPALSSESAGHVVATPSQRHPLIATDFYQVLETSDVPAGVVNLVTGERDVLAKTLAEHDDVALVAMPQRRSERTVRAGREHDDALPGCGTRGRLPGDDVLPVLALALAALAEVGLVAADEAVRLEEVVGR